MSSGIINPAILDLTRHSYSKPAFAYDTASLIEDAETQLIGQNVDFDSMVGIGLSGLLVLPVLARHFNVPFFACRKGEESHHNRELPEGGGRIGRKWILIDDAIVTGSTIKKVQSIIETVANRYNFETEFMGTYFYQHFSAEFGSFKSPEEYSDPRSVSKIEIDGEAAYVSSYMFKAVSDVMQAKALDRRETAVTETLNHFRRKNFNGWDVETMINIVHYVDSTLDSW